MGPARIVCSFGQGETFRILLALASLGKKAALALAIVGLYLSRKNDVV